MGTIYDPQTLGLEVFSISGEEARVRCPFHHDNTPSASFNVVKGLFHCYGCGENANARRLAAELGGDVVMLDSVKKINVADSSDDREWHELLLSPLALRNRYMKKRHVPDWLIKKFRVLKTKEGIVFPLSDPFGTITGVQMRRFDEKPKYDFLGKRQPVWPMESVSKPSKYGAIFLTEGVFGVLRAESASVHAAAVMGAGAILPAVRLLSGRKLVSVFDNDFAGLLASAKLLTFGIPAAYPTFEADEANIDFWKDFAHRAGVGGSTTTSVYQLLDQSPEADAIFKAWTKWRERMNRKTRLTR